MFLMHMWHPYARLIAIQCSHTDYDRDKPKTIKIDIMSWNNVPSVATYVPVHCISNELTLLKYSVVGLVQSGHHLLIERKCSSHDAAGIKVTWC